MDKPRPVALDLFCGAGGASLGLLAAGFVVHGMDITLRRRDGTLRNPVITRAIERDVTALGAADLRGYDFIWASPPCQAFSAVRRLQADGGGAPTWCCPGRKSASRGCSAAGILSSSTCRRRRRWMMCAPRANTLPR